MLRPHFNFSILNISPRTEQHRAVCVALASIENEHCVHHCFSVYHGKSFCLVLALFIENVFKYWSRKDEVLKTFDKVKQGMYKRINTQEWNREMICTSKSLSKLWGSLQKRFYFYFGTLTNEITWECV